MLALAGIAHPTMRYRHYWRRSGGTSLRVAIAQCWASLEAIIKYHREFLLRSHLAVEFPPAIFAQGCPPWRS